MRKFALKNPKSGLPDYLLTLTVAAGAVSILRFMLDGITFMFNGTPVVIPHTDPSAYAALLGPVLGSHAYTHTRTDAPEAVEEQEVTGKVDNPDA